MNASIVQTHPLIQIRRKRILPFAGTVLVRVGQKVTTSEVIAEMEIPSQFHYVDVMRSLGLASPAQAEKLINRKVGDQVDKNDILAETGGMFSKIINPFRLPGAAAWQSTLVLLPDPYNCRFCK